MSIDVTGDLMYKLAQNAADAGFTGDSNSGWFGIGASLPDKETRQPVWVPGKGYRINRADGSQTHLTNRENQWWGIRPDDVTQRLERESAEALEAKLTAKGDRERAEERTRWGASHDLAVKGFQAQLEGMRADSARILAQINGQVEQQKRQIELGRDQLGVTERQGDRQLSLQEGQLANANLIAQGQLDLSRDNAAFNRDQAVYQNDLMAWRYAQEQASAERARISGIAESLRRAFEAWGGLSLH